MKLTIVAATGGIGRLILTAGRRRRARRHRRRAEPGQGHRLASAWSRPTCPGRTRHARRRDGGADAALSGLGGHSRADEDIAAGGTRAIVTAMRRPACAGSSSSVRPRSGPSVAGTPASAEARPGDGFMMRHLLGARGQGRRCAGTTPTWRGWRAFCATAAWTGPWCGRRGSPDKPATGRYRTAIGQNVRGGAFISRADVAAYARAGAAGPRGTAARSLPSPTEPGDPGLGAGRPRCRGPR